jgi:hypothetical protein
MSAASAAAEGTRIDVRPNRKEQPLRESLTGKQWRLKRIAPDRAKRAEVGG